ncbi:hypothetical protein COW96_00890 [Candidatus Roizmanbacteria bacterium CG22_combo_CG10-13_8_21_14_all_33_16]|uniref:Nucleotidyl transferase AbiEii/AbiGii toxin family protein n=1 Tax=Candidatus Roizmanbacteria bacterium CG22_combo_CG10-13_8_21_14_all_33_16 TaxID=1974859 RepID=A0A2H0C497_9BACT|nr:MAG: hypothetical protein COW96_00890 [Candidatus Roizmanbacteria bacterium CG22_combo_CG10-13_8_21_14_all_33_16]
MLNYSFILEKSQKERIDRVTVEREYWQLLFLQKLYQLSGSQKVYFKGGTAIRFLYQSFRFSEDLDFTSILSWKDTEKLLLEVFDFFKNKTNIELEYVKNPVPERFELDSLKYRLFFFPYQSKHKTSIRIDISLREKPQTKGVSVLIPFDYPIAPYPLVVHLSAKELLSEKIRALFKRNKPRDLFDLWFMLTKKTTIDDEMITLKFKYYPELIYNRSKLIEIVKNYNEKELKNDLNQFLPEQYRNFYKQLKKETLKMLI